MLVNPLRTPQRLSLSRTRQLWPELTLKGLGLWVFFALWAFFVLAGLGLAPKGATEIASFLVSPFVRQEQMDTRVSNVQGSIASLAPLVANAKPKIIIPDVSIRSIIVFPPSADYNVLNTALTQGVVHYPGSALPGEDGNVFLFGHSTGLEVVHNKNFEAFNRLKELTPGDIIRIRYGEYEHWYRVRSLSIKKADSALVDLGTKKKMLTLSTCRIFGPNAKDDRYVVEADFVKSYPLQSA